MFLYNLTVSRRSNAMYYLSVLDKREHQSRRICPPSRCTSHWLWTAETRCQCSHPWWSAALNFSSHKTLSLHSNSASNHRCRNSSSDCSRCNTMMWRCYHQQLLMLHQSSTIRKDNLQYVVYNGIYTVIQQRQMNIDLHSAPLWEVHQLKRSCMDHTVFTLQIPAFMLLWLWVLSKYPEQQTRNNYPRSILVQQNVI